MKSLKLLFLVVGLAFSPVLFSSCGTPPSQRVVTVQTLKAVGETAEAAVKVSAGLYASHQISDVQARAVIALYDQRFQPAFRVAVATANADLSSIASPELLNIAAQLSQLVASYKIPVSP